MKRLLSLVGLPGLTPDLVWSLGIRWLACSVVVAAGFPACAGAVSADATCESEVMSSARVAITEALDRASVSGIALRCRSQSTTRAIHRARRQLLHRDDHDRVDRDRCQHAALGRDLPDTQRWPRPR